MSEVIKIGISSCLLGNKVRYDGGHTLDRFLVGTLGQHVQYVPVCPETECGLGVPRETMRLVGDPKSPRLVTTKTKIDHTQKMQSWAKTRLKELAQENLCGFIFKSKSPSSGMARVKIYNDNGMPRNVGIGIFAGMFMAAFPLIPVEEEGRLNDPGLRENFIERVFTLKSWRDMRKKIAGLGRLVDFHTRIKLLLLAHSPKDYRALGRLVAEGKKHSLSALYNQYETTLMAGLRLKATVKKNTNVLQHMLGYFKKQLSPDEKQELVKIIDQYHQELIPLIVPVTLFNHYVRKYDVFYLAQQTYLNPHPIHLKLRNHA
jgi:uncharacterized protein YbgA (DUF1722 family)/uncharacterized protein YbbK (DUF523 family)